MNHLWWIIPVSILLAALLWAVGDLVLFKIADGRNQKRRRSHNLEVEREFPVLAKSIFRVLTNSDPWLEGLEFDEDEEEKYDDDEEEAYYESCAVAIVPQLAADMGLRDIQAILKEMDLIPNNEQWFSEAELESLADDIWDAWQEHLAREI